MLKGTEPKAISAIRDYGESGERTVWSPRVHLSSASWAAISEPPSASQPVSIARATHALLAAEFARLSTVRRDARRREFAVPPSPLQQIGPEPEGKGKSDGMVGNRPSKRQELGIGRHGSG